MDRTPYSKEGGGKFCGSWRVMTGWISESDTKGLKAECSLLSGVASSCVWLEGFAQESLGASVPIPYWQGDEQYLKESLAAPDPGASSTLEWHANHWTLCLCPCATRVGGTPRGAAISQQMATPIPRATPTAQSFVPHWSWDGPYKLPSFAGRSPPGMMTHNLAELPIER